MVNSVDPDEMARYEPSHLDLHCLHRYWLWSAGLKGVASPLVSHLTHIMLKVVFWHMRKEDRSD